MGEATIQENRGERLAWCTKDCQRTFYAMKAFIGAQAAAAPMEPIGYGLFGFIRGPPDNPDAEPVPNMRDLFYDIVKQGIVSIKVASIPAEGAGFPAVGGGITLMETVIAENLEMMFLPADAQDQGFTENQRRRVFNFLFSPSKGKGLQTVLGVTNMPAFKQRVLRIAIRRGYYHTAAYLVKHYRVKLRAVLIDDGMHLTEVFPMLAQVPLERRMPTLEWLLDTMSKESVHLTSTRYLTRALTNVIIGTDDVPLYRKVAAIYPDGNHACAFLGQAVKAQALNIVVEMTSQPDMEVFYACDELLKALLVDPFTDKANAIVTILLQRLPISYIGSPQSVLHAAMYRDRTDVYEAVINAVDNVHRDVRGLMVSAARSGDHQYVRIYARCPAAPAHARDTISSLVSGNADLNDEIWMDIRMLLEARPQDASSNLIDQAVREQSPYVLVDIMYDAKPFAILWASVRNNDGDLLRALFDRETPRVPLSQLQRLALSDEAARQGSVRSLRVLQDEIRLSDEEIFHSAAMHGSPAYIIQIISMTKMNGGVLKRLVDPAVVDSRDRPRPATYARAKALLFALLAATPELLWEDWAYWRPLYTEFGLVNEAKAFEDVRQRRETGKSSRQVEKRVVL
jgi:hypothetical protein